MLCVASKPLTLLLAPYTFFAASCESVCFQNKTLKISGDMGDRESAQIVLLEMHTKMSEMKTRMNGKADISEEEITELEDQQ